MEDKEQKIKISFETNADDTAKKIDKVNSALDETSSSSGSVVQETEKLTKSQTKAADAVSKNGGAMAILNTITGGYAQVLKDAYEASDLFSGGMGRALSGVKKFSTGAKAALISTGIGALVVLVGTLVTYWDDIVGLVSGVSSELKNQNKLVEETAKAEQDKLDTLNGQDNVLKLQGKTEKEILQLKKNQTDETIAALTAQLESQEAIKKAQVEASQRNKDILSGALKFISAPITLLLMGIDEIGKAFGKDFGLTNVFDNISNLVFDPEEVAAEGDETINETKKRLDSLKNARAGYQLSIDNIDKEAFEKRKAKNDEEFKKEKERLASLLKERLDFESKLSDEIEDLEDDTEEKKLQRQKDRAIEEIELLKQKGIDVENITRLNDEKFMILEAELFDKRAKEREEKQAIEDAKILEEKRKAEEKALAEQKIIDDAKLKLLEQTENAKVDITNKALNLFSILAGKNKKLQKAAIIAEGAVGLARTVRNTIEGNTAALALGIRDLGPIAGPVAAAPAITANTISGALSGATIIAQTGIALKALGGGGGGLSNSSVGGGGSAPTSAAPQVSFQASSENQIANATASNLSNQPIEAFIVESSVSTATQLANNRITSNSL